MIIFDLKCSNSHTFEGWFDDNEDFQKQQASGLLVCPVCESGEVEKVLGGKPMLKSRKAAEPKQTAPSEKKQPKAKKQQVDPVVLLKAIQTHVQKNFTDVGSNFYKEAVAMHEGEKPQRKIYGEVTPEERKKLEDKDIDYMVLPKLGPQFDN